MTYFVASIWPVFSWVFFASCKSVIVIGLVLLCRQLFARWFSARDRHTLWFAVIACLVLPFGPQVDAYLVSPLSLIAEWRPSGNSTETRRMSAGENVLVAIQVAQPKAASNPAIRSLPRGSAAIVEAEPVARNVARSIFVWLWLGVVALLFGFTQWNLVRYFQIKSQAREVDAATAQLFLQCKTGLGVRRDVRLLETSRITSPAIFGWWSPTLLLPLSLSNDLSASQLRHVFLHELAHVQRNDILVNWLATMVQILHWFNPFVWYALRTMRDDMEQACDARVVGNWPRKDQMDYGSTLIRLADFYPKRMPLAHGACIAESHSQLTERITMIAQFSSSRVNRALLAAVVLVTITSVAVTQPRTDSAAPIEPRVVSAGLIDATPPKPIAAKFSSSHSTMPQAIPATEAMQRKSASNAKASHSVKLPIVEPIKLAAAGKELGAKEPLRTEYRRLSYAKAYDLAILIKPISGTSILSERGSVIVDERTNTLVLRDTAERLSDIQKVLGALDIPVQRIQLSMRIVLIDGDLMRDLIGETAPSSGVAPMPQANKGFDAKLSAAVDEGRAEIVAVPRVVTINGKEAMVQQGIELPSQGLADESSIGDLSSNKSKRVVLTLRVTPKVAANNRIDLDLDALMHDFDPSDKGETRRIATKAEMNDGYTVVLDGLLRVDKHDSNSSASIAKTPKSHAQLVVLLTPTLLPKQEPLYPAAL